MKERHPIISALEHQIRIQDEIISKNDFSRLNVMYQNKIVINQEILTYRYMQQVPSEGNKNW